MVSPIDVLVLSVPGLSARMLAEYQSPLPAIQKLARNGTAATVAVLEGASPNQLETAVFTGMLPEYAKAQPFWLTAGIPAHVEAQFQMPQGWVVADRGPRLRWNTHDVLHEPDALQRVDSAVREVRKGALVLLSAWAAPGQTLLDRPVLISRGIEQDKTCVGILEIAGILQRALTGERVTDAT
jgi:hypothetical protein